MLPPGRRRSRQGSGSGQAQGQGQVRLAVRQARRQGALSGLPGQPDRTVSPLPTCPVPSLIPSSIHPSDRHPVILSRIRRARARTRVGPPGAVRVRSGAVRLTVCPGVRLSGSGQAPGAGVRVSPDRQTSPCPCLSNRLPVGVRVRPPGSGPDAPRPGPDRPGLSFRSGSSGCAAEAGRRPGTGTGQARVRPGARPGAQAPRPGSEVGVPGPGSGFARPGQVRVRAPCPVRPRRLGLVRVPGQARLRRCPGQAGPGQGPGSGPRPRGPGPFRTGPGCGARVGQGQAVRPDQDWVIPSVPSSIRLLTTRLIIIHPTPARSTGRRGRACRPGSGQAVVSPSPGQAQARGQPGQARPGQGQARPGPGQARQGQTVPSSFARQGRTPSGQAPDRPRPGSGQAPSGQAPDRLGQARAPGTPAPWPRLARPVQGQALLALAQAPGRSDRPVPGAQARLPRPGGLRVRPGVRPGPGPGSSRPVSRSGQVPGQVRVRPLLPLRSGSSDQSS